MKRSSKGPTIQFIMITDNNGRKHVQATTFFKYKDKDFNVLNS